MNEFIVRFCSNLYRSSIFYRRHHKPSSISFTYASTYMCISQNKVAWASHYVSCTGTQLNLPIYYCVYGYVALFTFSKLNIFYYIWFSSCVYANFTVYQFLYNEATCDVQYILIRVYYAYNTRLGLYCIGILRTQEQRGFTSYALGFYITATSDAELYFMPWMMCTILRVCSAL